MLHRILAIAIATALLTAGAAMAQPRATGDTAATPAGTTTTGSSTTTSSEVTPSAESTTATRTDNDAATPAGATSMTRTAAPQGQDATFLQRAMEVNRIEIASARDALENAQRSDTRTAARMLLDDHQRAGEQLQQLASRKGWALPAAPASVESDQVRINTASGSGFDDDFMEEQIRMHRDAISLYRAQVSGGADPDLRGFARDQLPHLEHHLEMLQGAQTQK